MPLQICPKCKRFHYVPGECPVPKVAADLSAGAAKPPKAPPAKKTRLNIAAKAQAETIELTKLGTPRKRAPKGTFDRKAWQRSAAKKRRAKAKDKP